MPFKIKVKFEDGTEESFNYPTQKEIEDEMSRLKPIVDFFNPDLYENVVPFEKKDK